MYNILLSNYRLLLLYTEFIPNLVFYFLKIPLFLHFILFVETHDVCCKQMKTCVRFQIEKSSIKYIRSCRIKHNLHIQLRTTSGSGETEESAEHVIPAGLWSHCHPVTGMLEWKDTGSLGRAGRGNMEEMTPSLSVTSRSAWISSHHGYGWALWGQD